MRPGRDSIALLVMVVAVALLGWLSHTVSQHNATPPPDLASPPSDDATSWKFSDGRPHDHDGPGGVGHPPREMRPGGPFPRHPDEQPLTPLLPDDPLLAGRDAQRWSRGATFTLRVEGNGWLRVGKGRHHGQVGGTRFTREARFTFALRDGDLVEAERQGHVLPVRRIPRDTTACQISPDGLVLAYCNAPGEARETIYSCGYVEIATADVPDAVIEDPTQPGWWQPGESLARFSSGRAGSDGRGTLVVAP